MEELFRKWEFDYQFASKFHDDDHSTDTICTLQNDLWKFRALCRKSLDIKTQLSLGHDDRLLDIYVRNVAEAIKARIADKEVTDFALKRIKKIEIFVFLIPLLALAHLFLDFRIFEVDMFETSVSIIIFVLAILVLEARRHFILGLQQTGCFRWERSIEDFDNRITSIIGFPVGYANLRYFAEVASTQVIDCEITFLQALSSFKYLTQSEQEENLWEQELYEKFYNYQFKLRPYPVSLSYLKKIKEP